MMHFSLLFFVVLTAQSIVREAATSEQNVSKYQASASFNNRRYRLSTDAVFYDVAERECSRDGGTLAIVTSQGITDAIENMLQQSSLRGAKQANANLINDGVWIGLKLSRNNIFRGTWSDGTIFNNDYSYSKWVPEEPRRGRDTICIQLWRAFLWCWDNTYCDENKYYICEDPDPQNYSAEKIEDLSTSIVKLGSSSVPDVDDLNKMVTKVDSYLNITSEAIQNNESSGRDILFAIENITNNYAVELGDFSRNSENLAMTIQDLSDATIQEQEVVFGEDVSQDVDMASSVTLSQTLLKEAQDKAGTSRIQVSSVLYRKTFLFEASNAKLESTSLFGEGAARRDSPKVLSRVISVDVQNVKMNDLKSPVVIRHRYSYSALNASNDKKIVEDASFVQEFIDQGNTTQLVINRMISNQSIRRESRLQCVFWDFTMNDNEGDWSTNGCNLSSIKNESGKMVVTCLCDHMTNFAIILDSSEYYEPEYLSHITIFGCAVSIACLLATLLTNLYFKQLRTKLPQQILIQICFSLIILNGTFLIGIDRTGNDTFCIVTTVLLHYAVLLSWSWMLTEGIFLYRTLVLSRIGSGTGTCFIWCASFLCYGLPAAIVAVLATQVEGYTSKRYCWISGDTLLYSIVIPIAIILVMNCVIFFVIMYNITLRSQMFRKNIDLKKISQSLRRAACMMFVLGLPWIFGYIMLLSKAAHVKTVFSVIFTIFNAFQGVAIFVLYCVRQENVRSLWFTPARRQYRRTIKRLKPANYKRERSEIELSQTSDATNSRKKISIDSPQTIETQSPQSCSNVYEVIKNTEVPPNRPPFRSNWQ